MKNAEQLIHRLFAENRAVFFEAAVSTAQRISTISGADAQIALDAMADTYIFAAFDLYAKAAADRNEQMSPDRIADQMMRAFAHAIRNGGELQ